MDNSFFIYLEQLELMGFFSGYFLIYLLVKFTADVLLQKKIIYINLTMLLPYAYAIVGIMFLGFQLKNLYPDYSIDNLKSTTQNAFLKILALLSVFFFIPALAKKPVLSVLHSLVFFYFIVRDLFLYFFKDADNNLLQNDMNIYARSILLNLISFLLVALFYFLFIFLKRKNTR